MNTTTTVHFASRDGKVMSRFAQPRAKVQAYVNRNNYAARCRGDNTEPYAVLSYRIPQ